MLFYFNPNSLKYVYSEMCMYGRLTTLQFNIITAIPVLFSVFLHSGFYKEKLLVAPGQYDHLLSASRI
jgi:hypothetical protein